MKLVAAKAFHNSKKLRVTLDPKDSLFQHPAHVHKGARFSIGSGENYKDLGGEEQEHIGTLLKHGIAVLDNKENADNDVIATIDREVAAQVKMEKANTAPPTLMDVIGTLIKQNQEIIAAFSAKK